MSTIPQNDFQRLVFEDLKEIKHALKEIKMKFADLLALEDLEVTEITAIGTAVDALNTAIANAGTTVPADVAAAAASLKTAIDAVAAKVAPATPPTPGP